MNSGLPSELHFTDEGYYSSLIGSYLMDSEMKFREFFRFVGIFHFTLKEIKEDIRTPSCNRWQRTISAEQRLSYTKVSKRP